MPGAVVQAYLSSSHLAGWTSSQCFSCLFPVLPTAIYCGWDWDLNCRLVSNPRSSSSFRWTLSVSFLVASSRGCYQDFWSAHSLIDGGTAQGDGDHPWFLADCSLWSSPAHASPWQSICFLHWANSFNHQEDWGSSWTADFVSSQNFFLFALLYQGIFSDYSIPSYWTFEDNEVQSGLDSISNIFLKNLNH